MKWLGILICMWSFGAGAINIRVIGNGGGDTEMRALSFFDDIPLILFLCAQPDNPCDLNDREVEVFSALLKAEQEGAGPKTLEFHSSGELYYFRVEQERLSIHSSALEQNLTTTVFTGYARYVLREDIQFRMVPDHLFSSPWAVRSLDLGGSMRLQFLEFLNQAAVLLESDEGYYQDLSPQIGAALGCSPGGRLLGFRGPRREGRGVKVEITWQCEDRRFSANLLGRPEGSEWRFQIFGLHSLPVSANDPCRRLL